jgi:hypothetical protein
LSAATTKSVRSAATVLTYSKFVEMGKIGALSGVALAILFEDFSINK